MRLERLPVGLVRLARPTLYIPPAPVRRTGFGRLLVLACAGYFAPTGAVGEQNIFATVTADRPQWMAALRAPDPGIALSPFLEGRLTPAVAEIDRARGRGEKADLQASVLRKAPPPPPGPAPQVMLASTQNTSSGTAATVQPRAAPALTEPSNVVAYVPERVDIAAPFQLLFQGEPPHGVSGNGLDHWWSDRPLPKNITAKKSLECLARAVYFEARGEPIRGQEAVAQVVINRVKNPAYPDDVCGVVYQNKHWRNRCQFTFACDRIEDRVRDRQAWQVAMDVAKRYASGKMWLAKIGAATHYHADHVSPRWARMMRRVKTIDSHIFYVTRGGGWT